VAEEGQTSAVLVPRWLALLLGLVIVWLVSLDSISSLLWTPSQVRALLAWKLEMPDAKALEAREDRLSEMIGALEERVKALETELRISHERYLDLLNRRSD